MCLMNHFFELVKLIPLLDDSIMELLSTFDISILSCFLLSSVQCLYGIK